MLCAHACAVWRGRSWGATVVKINAERDREVQDDDVEADRGRRTAKPEQFSVLQESERAISSLEAKVNALERRRLRES
jgi:hypothetical protein